MYKRVAGYRADYSDPHFTNMDEYGVALAHL